MGCYLPATKKNESSTLGRAVALRKCNGPRLSSGGLAYCVCFREVRRHAGGSHGGPADGNVSISLEISKPNTLYHTISL